jgi:hypothetical protein
MLEPRAMSGTLREPPHGFEASLASLGIIARCHAVVLHSSFNST